MRPRLIFDGHKSAVENFMSQEPPDQKPRLRKPHKASDNPPENPSTDDGDGPVDESDDGPATAPDDLGE